MEERMIEALADEYRCFDPSLTETLAKEIGQVNDQDQDSAVSFLSSNFVPNQHVKIFALLLLLSR